MYFHMQHRPLLRGLELHGGLRVLVRVWLGSCLLRHQRGMLLFVLIAAGASH